MPASARPSRADVEDQLRRILESPQFRDSPRLQSFLRFVVLRTLDGKPEEVKESNIASEVFGRTDMSDDSIVRSSARRLRTRLEEYYQGEGMHTTVLIVIPKGSYVPVIEAREAVEAVVNPEPHSVSNLPSKKSNIWSFNTRFAVLVIVGASALIGGVLVWRHREYKDANQTADHELYLKGRYYWNKRTPDDLTRAVDYFTQAIVKNPRDAETYSGLADAYNLFSEYTAMPYREAFKRARAAAQTAIQLDPKLPEAHNSLAFAAFWGDWDRGTAEREFKRALELDPNYATAHHWYATFLMTNGRSQQALQEIERAQKLNPSSASILADKGCILMYSGDINNATALLKELEISDPNLVSPHRYLAVTHLLQNNYSLYLAEMKTVAVLSRAKGQLSVIEAGQKGLLAGGPPEMLDAMLRTKEAVADEDETHDYSLAQLSALLGKKEQSIRLLQAALARRDVNLLILPLDTTFSCLRGNPEFQAILRSIDNPSRQAS